MSAIREAVLRHIHAHPDSSRLTVAQALALPLDEVQREMIHLAVDGLIVGSEKWWQEGGREPLYRAIASVGTCECCGATDHHLVSGLCAICAGKTQTVYVAPGIDDEEVPLGVESANATPLSRGPRLDPIDESDMRHMGIAR